MFCITTPQKQQQTPTATHANNCKHHETKLVTANTEQIESTLS